MRQCLYPEGHGDLGKARQMWLAGCRFKAKNRYLGGLDRLTYQTPVYRSEEEETERTAIEEKTIQYWPYGSR